jgi:signal transduction histidine kinase
VSPALPAWLRRPSPHLVDVALAVLIGVPTLATAIDSGVRKDKPALGVLFGLLAAVPLVVRRRRPFAALAVVIAAAVAAPVSVPYELPMMVLLYTIGSTRGWERTIAAGGAVVAVGGIFLLAGGPGFNAGNLIGTALLCAISSGLGLYVGTKRAGMDALRDRAERLDRERELLAERAVAEERVRIAQELHDVVAHNVSLIVVQAQALGVTAGDEHVKQATDGIADLGRQTMTEMHRTLRLLRGSDDDATPFAPQPGLSDLDTLLARSRATGLDVDVTIGGAPRPLPQSVDLSAFRIVQEALTNVVKHAGRARTTVTVDYGAQALELTIVDDGQRGTPNGPPAPGGHGLVGMRERTALFGGTLAAGPRAGRGFEVRASLPYDEGRR